MPEQEVANDGLFTKNQKNVTDPTHSEEGVGNEATPDFGEANEKKKGGAQLLEKTKKTKKKTKKN